MDNEEMFSDHKPKDSFYGVPLYERYFADWTEIAHEFIPHYLYYTPNDKGGRAVWCTYCGEFIEVYSDKDIYSDTTGLLKSKHGENVECPCCFTYLKLIAFKKLTSYNSLSKTQRFIFSDIIDHDHVQFFACKVTNYPDKDEAFQYIDIEPVSRYMLSPGCVRMWRYKDDTWQEQKQFGEPFLTSYGAGGDYQFAFDLNDYGFDDCFLKYSNFIDFVNCVPVRNNHNHHNDCFMMTYLCYYSLYPKLEFLLKNSVYEPVSDLVYWRRKNSDLLNWKADTAYGFFRLQKKHLKLFASTGFSFGLLRFYREHMKEMTLEQVVFMFSKFGSSELNTVFDIISIAGMDVSRLYNYINAQSSGYGCSFMSHALRDYLDYIKLAVDFKMDLSEKEVLYPSCLRDAHDALYALSFEKVYSGLEKKYSYTFLDRDKRYFFEDERFVVYLPHTASEIISESVMQSNCVKGYIERHFKNETTILFLREKSRIRDSFITIEMRGTEFIQKYGLFNDNSFRANTPSKKERWLDYMSRPRDDAQAFFDKWLAWVKKGSLRDSRGKPVVSDMSESKIECEVNVS